jgi:glycosyltransferase involved in cell wall biosynthesis
VFSVPTEYEEPKGRYAFEAMASGLPVVLPEHGAFPELIQQSNGGILVPAADPIALANELERLLHDHDLRNELGQAGRQHVLEYRNAAAMASQTAKAIQEFLTAKSQ